MGSPKVVLDPDPILLLINTPGMHLEHGSQKHTGIFDFDTTKKSPKMNKSIQLFLDLLFPVV